jgi:hypothetical protein
MNYKRWQRKASQKVTWEGFPSVKHFRCGKCYLAEKYFPVGKCFPFGNHFPLGMNFPVEKRFPQTTMRRHHNKETFPEGNLLEFFEIFTPASNC